MPPSVYMNRALGARSWHWASNAGILMWVTGVLAGILTVRLNACSQIYFFKKSLCFQCSETSNVCTLAWSIFIHLTGCSWACSVWPFMSSLGEVFYSCFLLMSSLRFSSPCKSFYLDRIVWLVSLVPLSFLAYILFVFLIYFLGDLLICTF